MRFQQLADAIELGAEDKLTKREKLIREHMDRVVWTLRQTWGKSPDLIEYMHAAIVLAKNFDHQYPNEPSHTRIVAKVVSDMYEHRNDE